MICKSDFFHFNILMFLLLDLNVCPIFKKLISPLQLIQFLMSLVQPSRNGPLKSGMKRRYQLMINNAAHNAEDRGRDSKSPRLEPDPDYELDENDVDFENVVSSH